MVCFDKRELEIFNIDELKKMMKILIQSEKFEGASVIRDIIDDRKRGFNFNQEDNEDDAELL